MRYIDTGTRDPRQAIGTWMTEFDASSVEELRFQTGFFGITGIAPISHILERLRLDDKQTVLLIGSNELGTGGGDIHELVATLGLPRSNAKLAICAFDNGYFHPKVVHIRRIDGSQAAYVGSANLTAPGVSGQHIEAGVLLDTRDGDPTGELSRIALSIDGWFSTASTGVFRVGSDGDVDDLVARGVLAGVAQPDENQNRSKRSPTAKVLRLAPLRPLISLAPRPVRHLRRTARPTSATSLSITRQRPVGSPAEFFMMDLPKNRGGRSYQADIGKEAFTRFFPGKIGGRVNVRINTIDVRGSSTSKARQLVNVRSRNYRVEIDFPGKYPESGSRPIVVFRKLSALEFDCLLLLPSNGEYANAEGVLAVAAAPRRIRRARVSEADVRRLWPTCPLP